MIPVLTAANQVWRLKCMCPIVVLIVAMQAAVFAEETDIPSWNYAPKLLRPFWEGDTVEGESVLFIRNSAIGEAAASVLFPVQKILAVRNSADTAAFEEGRDYTWKPGSREIVLPGSARIVSRTPQQLRRPAEGGSRFVWFRSV